MNPPFALVIDITLGSYGLMDSITDWEVSMEPSLSDHRHILFNLRGSTPVLYISNPMDTNRRSFRGSLGEKLRRGQEMNMRDEAGLGQGHEISEVESGIRTPQEGSTSVTFASLVWWPGCETACAKKN